MRRGYDFFSFFLSNGKGEGGRGRVVRMEERDGVMREKEGDRALGTGGVEGGREGEAGRGEGDRIVASDPLPCVRGGDGLVASGPRQAAALGRRG